MTSKSKGLFTAQCVKQVKEWKIPPQVVWQLSDYWTKENRNPVVPFFFKYLVVLHLRDIPLCWQSYMFKRKGTRWEDSDKNLKCIIHIYLKKCHKCTTILGFQDSSKEKDIQILSVLHLEEDDSLRQWFNEAMTGLFPKPTQPEHLSEWLY